MSKDERRYGVGVVVVTVETHVEDALERVEREREHFQNRLEAIERFQREVREIQPVTGRPSGLPATDGGVGVVSTAVGVPSGDRCEAVRDLFAETVYPASVTDGEELLQTISEELSETISLALAAGTDQQFAPAVKRSVLSASADREAEIEAMLDALDAERSSLSTVREGVTEMTAWLAEADRTPLIQLDFEALEKRHDRLESYRERGDRLSKTRQQHVHGTTSQGGTAGVEHEQLVEFLYQSFPVSYPALTTLANLDEVCKMSQRRVRDHLARRV